MPPPLDLVIWSCRNGSSVEERGTHPRAWDSAFVQHSEMNCRRRHMYWQSKTLYWEGAHQQQGKGTQENCSATWLRVSGFTVMGLVSGSGQSSFLAHIWSHSGSFLVVHASLSRDGFQCKGFWEVGRTYCVLASPASLWPLLNTPGLFWWQYHVPYWDLLLWGNSCEWLFSCLAKAGGCSLWFPSSSF